jgi:NADP-dependent aldehyde dehydrogenase
MTAPTAITGVNLVGATDLPGTGAAVTGIDPASGAALEPVYHEASTADVERATALAWEAFGSYRHTTLEQRAAFLETIATEIENLASILVDRVIAETGIAEARVQGEVARTTGQLRMFASVVREGSWTQAQLDTPNPDRTPLPKPDLRQREVPLGPVAVFSASNFPLAFSVAGGDTASALAAGAPVIVKAHPAHPGTSELVGRAVRRAVQEHNLPEGTFSLVLGGPEVGIALVTDPRVRAVGFTGSRQGGLALTAAAAGRPVPIPVYAEMSSINPVFVLPGALAERGTDLGSAFIASMIMWTSRERQAPRRGGLSNHPYAATHGSWTRTSTSRALGHPLRIHGLQPVVCDVGFLTTSVSPVAPTGCRGARVQSRAGDRTGRETTQEVPPRR